MNLLAALIVMASPALADDNSYAGHKGVLLFTEAPCGAVIDAIDLPTPEYPSDTEVFFYGTKPHFQRMGDRQAITGMAWGFILGYDTAKGGLHDDKKSTLERLREACEAEPQTPAVKLLDGLSNPAALTIQPK